jgi:hypothetical protein
LTVLAVHRLISLPGFRAADLLDRDHGVGLGELLDRGDLGRDGRLVVAGLDQPPGLVDLDLDVQPDRVRRRRRAGKSRAA